MKNIAQTAAAVNSAIQEFQEKKALTDGVAGLYAQFDDGKAKRLRLCGEILTFATLPDGSKELLEAYFCQVRLCPLCSWRRSQRTFYNVLAIIQAREFLEQKQQFVFLTLTFRNVPAEGLSPALDCLTGGFRKLSDNEHKPFRRAFTGMFRAIEITYNPEEKNYHAHMHVLASVVSGYFKKTNPDYISHERLMELWRGAIRADYDPWVDIRKCRGAAYKSVAEVAKYTVKAASIVSADELRVLDRALHRRRLVGYVGLFKKVKARLHLEDEDDFTSLDSLRANPEIVKELYRWNIGTKTYELVRRE